MLPTPKKSTLYILQLSFISKMESLIENAETLGERIGWILEAIPKDTPLGPEMKDLLPMLTEVVSNLKEIVNSKAAEHEARTLELDKREHAIQEQERSLAKTMDSLSSHASSLERMMAVAKTFLVGDLQSTLEEVNKSVQSHQEFRELVARDEDHLKDARQQFQTQKDELLQDLRRQNDELQGKVKNHEAKVAIFDGKVKDYNRFVDLFGPQVDQVQQLNSELTGEKARVVQRDETIQDLTSQLTEAKKSLEESRQKERASAEALAQVTLETSPWMI